MEARSDIVVLSVVLATMFFHFLPEPVLGDNGIRSFGDYEQTTTEQKWYHNPVHMVVLFTRFSDEESTTLPEWSKKIFNGTPGSINHYFDTTSFGQIKVTGEVFPEIIMLPHTSDYYKYYNYTLDLLEILDNRNDFSFTQLDNDGPDGIPGSGDDDGYVDYLVLVPLSFPDNFITSTANGVSTLPLKLYESNDKDVFSRNIKVDSQSGCIVEGSFGYGSIGIIIHEYLHSFGIPDLYDLSSATQEDESAGIGFWGIMGHGSLGWNWSGIPVSICAYNKMRLGIIGKNNERLVDILGNLRNIRISDVSSPEGVVYRIWMSREEYFLIEYRRNDNNYYDRDVPANGLLIWHILNTSSGNSIEELKLCDLECADGLYTDAGYPLGSISAPNTGGDNLDFFSKNDDYRTAHAGNSGDATDVFDGVIYTSFGPDTNPNSNSTLTGRSSGISISNIRRDGDDILFDVENLLTFDLLARWTPLIGTGIHRLIELLPSVSKPDNNSHDVYLLSYLDEDGAARPTTLIAAGTDGITETDLTGQEQHAVDLLVNYTILSGMNAMPNATLVRRNLTQEEFETELPARYSPPLNPINGSTPVTIQKISLTYEEEDSHPSEITLLPNYPNPFNEATVISYYLPTAQQIRLDVYSIQGQLIRTYDQGRQDAGTHMISFSGEGLSSGVYIYRISGETATVSHKFVYLR